MKNIIYRLIIMSAFFQAMAVAEVRAQQTTLVKTLQQDFDVTPKASLELTNKYGDIIVNGWEQNKVLVKIRITTYGKDDEDTRKLMDRVEFDFNVSKEYVDIETVLDRKKGVLAEFFNTIGDYSKSLLSKNELDIDFEIFVPFDASLKISNKFGDIVIYDAKGKVDIDLAHGNFKAGEIFGVSKIAVNYGNISINEFMNGFINIRGGELEITKANKVNVRSSSSKLFLKDMDELTLESTSDNVKITKVKNLKGNGGFSNIDVYQLTGSCDYDQSYGEMVFHLISSDFSMVKLLGKSTDYAVNVAKGTSFQTEITAREDKLLLVEKPEKMEKVYTDEKEKYVKITGYYGKDPEAKPLLKVDSVNGQVSVDFSYPAK